MHRASLLILATLALPVSTLCAQEASNSSSSSSIVSPELLSGAGSPYAITVATPPAATRPAFGGFGVSVKAGVLGVGVETATSLSQHLNLRAGANFFNFNDQLSTDGIGYNANVHFRSAEAGVDWYPWAKRFHISPGALVYNGNRISGAAQVPGGQSFTLNGYTFYSSTADPVHGSGGITFAKAAPKLTVGWGNLVPRDGHHFSFPFEMGVAYVGDPAVALNLKGTVCAEPGMYCNTIASDPTVQADIAAEQQKIQKDASYARFFPILSTGIGYRF